jgi:hypothetical protein
VRRAFPSSNYWVKSIKCTIHSFITQEKFNSNSKRTHLVVTYMRASLLHFLSSLLSSMFNSGNSENPSHFGGKDAFFAKRYISLTTKGLAQILNS